jgi:pyridoxal phosphate enzyme (YggS family)
LRGTWHLIGHLQGNKAARAAKIFSSVDSIDDTATARRLDRARGEESAREKLRVLLEVRISEEETKSGAEPGDLRRLARDILSLHRIQLAGLMCIPPFFGEAEQVRPYFRRLRLLRDDLQEQIGEALPVLSMGMSHDFEVAIEEGATEVRVGTALFGTRRKPGT